MTRPYAEVIGDPIAHSKSPLIHNFWLAKLGIDAEYRACHVRPEELADYFTRRRRDAEWRGCNVTIPHKVRVLEYADEIESIAAEIGAANCMVPRDGELIALNTDHAGVGAAVRCAVSLVCLIGSGGAARSVFPPLDVLCAYDYRVLARDPAKAAAAFDDLPYEFTYFTFDQAEEAMRDADCVINASPLGMTGQPPMPQPVLDALGALGPQPLVFDMVYAPLETELLKAARALGIETSDGLTMLIGQAKFAFNHFFGVFPDEEHDAELRELLTA